MRHKFKEKVMMRVAIAMSALSTCQSKHVGAVIVKNGRIISSGYNGVPAHMEHCSDIVFATRQEHSEWSERHETHAEMNAILNAAKEGVSIDLSDMYVTMSPCWNCCKHAKSAGIKRIFYLEKYDRVKDDLETMQKTFNISIEQLEVGYENERQEDSPRTTIWCDSDQS